MTRSTRRWPRARHQKRVPNVIQVLARNVVHVLLRNLDHVSPRNVIHVCGPNVDQVSAPNVIQKHEGIRFQNRFRFTSKARPVFGPGLGRAFRRTRAQSYVVYYVLRPERGQKAGRIRVKTLLVFEFISGGFLESESPAFLNHV